MTRHDVEVVFVLLSKKQTSYFLTRKMKDWIEPCDSEHEVSVDKLIDCDYTLECAKFRAGGSVAAFLHYARVLAIKRAVFFRQSSPLRYMMECFLEEIKLLDVMTNVGSAVRKTLISVEPTVYRKTSVQQDHIARKKRKRHQAMEKASRAHEREEIISNRKRIHQLNAIIKAYEDLFKRRRTIIRVSKRFANSRRDWSFKQRELLIERMLSVESQRTRNRMNEVIDFYIGKTRGVYDGNNPHTWTVQTCRHVSHVIR